MKLSELLKKITPLPWRVRTHPQVGSFVEGECEGRAYGQQILGDDYGDDYEEQKQHDPIYVAHAANMLPDLMEACYEGLSYATCGCGHRACKKCKSEKFIREILAKAEEVKEPEK